MREPAGAGAPSGKKRRPCGSAFPPGRPRRRMWNTVYGRFSVSRVNAPSIEHPPLLKGVLKGEDSYRAGCWSGLFGGFLPLRPYFRPGQRRALTLGYPPIGLLGAWMIEPTEKKKAAFISPA